MPKANPALWRAPLRRVHIYLSVFVAPSLIFFAITGAFQTFRIPDQKTAPILLQKLAHVHRDDMFMVPPPRPQAAGKPKAPAAPKPAPKVSTTMLKWFFVAVSAIMVLTTLLGLWMAMAYSRERRLLWLLLIAGAAAPVVILLF